MQPNCQQNTDSDTNNYFAVGFALLDFLKTFPQFKAVEMLQSLNDVTENRQTTPAAYVVFDGSSPADSAGRGRANMEEQQWTVIVAVAHAAAQTQVYETMKDAGELITQVSQALQGKKMTQNSQPLVRTGGSRAGYSTAFSYFPLTFKTRFSIINRTA